MKVKITELVKKGENKIGDIVRVEAGDFVVAGELVNAFYDDLEEDKEYEAELVFYCHTIIDVFASIEEFRKKEKYMNHESFIPIGLMPPMNNEEDVYLKPFNYLNSTVDNVGVDLEELIILEEHILDNKIICVYYKNEVDVIPGIGEIVSAIYWCEVMIKEN